MTHRCLALLLLALAGLFSAQAQAQIDCSGLALSTFTRDDINKNLGGGSSVTVAQKYNYGFAGSCNLMLNAGINLAIPVPTTVAAEVTGSGSNFLVAEAIKFSYAGQVFNMTTLANCNGDPIYNTVMPVSCSGQHFTGAPPLGQMSDAQVPLTRTPGRNAQNMLLQKLDADRHLWYSTPTVQPVIVSPKAGETVDPRALKVEIRLPGTHPQWQACCEFWINFKTDHGMTSISPKLKINASTAQGNTIYVNIADMITQAAAGNGVLAGQNLNHAQMEIYVDDMDDTSVKIANDPSVIPQHNRSEQQVQFFLPRLSLGLGGPVVPAAAPANPYKAKPVFGSPNAGTSYTGDVYIRAQPLAKELTDDGYTCCKIEFERKNGGAWAIYTPGANIYSSKIDSAGINVALDMSGDYRVKLLTFAPVGGAFFSASDWLEFHFTKLGGSGAGKLADKSVDKNAQTSNPALDTMKLAPLPVPPGKGKK